MLNPQQLYDYQRAGVSHILTNDDAMLWWQMGLGKTIATLTAIVDRMRAGQVKKTLIFGPLRVIQSVWNTECRKWTHTNDLRCSIIHGKKDVRTRAMFINADIYLCNYEQMTWMAEMLVHHFIDKGKPIPFDMVVYDEVSKLKNANTRRMSGGRRDYQDAQGKDQVQKIIGWRKVIPYIKYRVGLTGTPASNGYLDLHGQYLAVDGGKRLGEFITHYKDNYFQSDYMGWKYVPTEEGKEKIENKIADITLKMDAAEYLDMPECKTINMMVDLPEKARKAYTDIERDMFTQLDNGSEIELFSRSSISNKTLQFCNGTPYVGETKEWEVLHDAKLDALEDVLEEASGQPVLCSYSFKSDAKRIMARFKKYKPVNLTETTSKNTSDVIQKWQNGEIKLLIGHPASMGHGIDGLQKTGSILVWFGINWSLELYEQMNGRLNRQGQTQTVSIIRILCKDTIDLAVADAIERKTDDQEGLKASLARYRRGEVNNDLVPSFF